MGRNALVSVTPGSALLDTHINQFYAAMLGDIYPRAISGIITAYAGNLGSLDTPWNTLYVNRIIGGGLSELHGDELPDSPNAGDRFVRTGSNPGYYICFVDGVWSNLGRGS